MFCPNCGHDCREYRFCSQCGTQVRNDSTLKAPSGEKDRAFSDTTQIPNVYKSKNTKKGSTEIPISGGYLGIAGSVVLSDSAVSVCAKRLFEKHRTLIPYDQLVTVIYKRPSLKPRSNGALLFRGEANKSVPIPREENLVGDRSAIGVSVEMDMLFYHLFYMLRAVAPPTARFEMIVPPNRIRGLDEMAKTVDMEYFYSMYAPYRERAASGIVAKHELKPIAARALVDRVFDAKQKQMYDADPLDAIRDLNLVVADIRREQQRINRADAERRKRYERERVAESLERLETMKELEMLDDYFEKRSR